MLLTQTFASLFILVSVVTAAGHSDVCNIGYCTLNGGTSGGSGGSTTTVTSLAALTAAVTGTAKKVYRALSGAITGTGRVDLGANTSLLGLPGSSLSGVGIGVHNTSNVIIRNLKVSKVVGGDGVQVQWSSNVWIDHVDVSSDRDHGLDYYDGAIDLTHQTQCCCHQSTHSTYSQHMKCVLIGADDSNTEDKLATITLANNYYNNIQTRSPMARFGTFHIYNTYFNDLDDSISTYMGAQMLVENNVWENSVNTVKTSKTDTRGYAVVRNNDYGSAKQPNMTAGTFTTAPYSTTLLSLTSIKSSAQSNAGQKLTWS
ncbi:pectate lyase B [Auriculariales sp. MPI-PUGE-AT-0066]|nr:pectate lyase B [Auriculariales sp. MPI-PUGE-AT-0066]